MGHFALFKACSNGPNNVSPTSFNKLETLGSAACWHDVVPTLLRPFEQAFKFQN